jgi:hypothetical protein
MLKNNYCIKGFALSPRRVRKTKSIIIPVEKGFCELKNKVGKVE